MVNRDCIICEGTGKMKKVKREYMSFCLLPQYIADEHMMEEVDCPCLKVDRTVFLTDEDWTDDYPEFPPEEES